jgi:hypothetical protein
MFKTIGSYLVQLYAGGMDGSTHNLGHLTSRHCCCALQATGAAGQHTTVSADFMRSRRDCRCSRRLTAFKKSACEITAV